MKRSGEADPAAVFRKTSREAAKLVASHWSHIASSPALQVDSLCDLQGMHIGHYAGLP